MSGAKLTSERLRQVVRYEPNTGCFFWVNPPRNQLRKGELAGSRSKKGYWRIVIDARAYPAHRLAWLWMTGDWPRDQIDHINCIRDDNRFENLRLATTVENKRNGRRYATNTSGFKGVSLRAPGKWRARISLNGRRVSLGRFDTPEEAGAAYAAAAIKYYGAFARTE